MMNITDIFQMIIFLGVVFLLAWSLGLYMARVYQGERTLLDPILSPIEKIIYWLSGLNVEKEMDWREYAFSTLVFNILGMLLLFLMQLAQRYLPFNPQHFDAVAPDLAFNTAVSFMTNTNWQAYGGESTMGYFVQMMGLTVQNFLSGATGIVVAIALIRGLSRHSVKTIGNFWVDLTRSVLWILLPLSFILSLLLVSQGVLQNLNPYLTAHTLEGAKQVIAMGPVASQEAIKMLGTNGGGFFNANSAHPFENPTPFSNFLEMLAIIIIPVALLFTFGKMLKNMKQGMAILSAMMLLFLLFLGVCYVSESVGNPQIQALGISGPSAMEGKETRFGIANSSLFTVVTTGVACGAVNNMHDSLTPLGGLVPMLLMMLGEVCPGGEGSGLYGMLMFVVLTVFIIGLMVGRTPEYLGKKIEAWEMKMATIAILVPATVILLSTALAVLTKSGLAGISNPGPHGLSEILYAFASGVGNNGSAFAGLGANSIFYNLMLALAMFTGRFGIIFPVLAIAGSMAEKKIIPASSGTFPTTGMIFIVLLTGTVLIVGALTFFPALALGPLVENLLMWSGKTF